MSLEELILRHAAGLEIPSFELGGEAAGVMMIPIPKAGILRSYAGTDQARTTPGIVGIEITAKLNYPIQPLPEGASYLGFIFARAPSAADAEEALRQAHAQLRFAISSVISMSSVPG